MKKIPYSRYTEREAYLTCFSFIFELCRNLSKTRDTLDLISLNKIDLLSNEFVNNLGDN